MSACLKSATRGDLTISSRTFAVPCVCKPDHLSFITTGCCEQLDFSGAQSCVGQEGTSSSLHITPQQYQMGANPSRPVYPMPTPGMVPVVYDTFPKSRSRRRAYSAAYAYRPPATYGYPICASPRDAQVYILTSRSRRWRRPQTPR